MKRFLPLLAVILILGGVSAFMRMNAPFVVTQPVPPKQSVEELRSQVVRKTAEIEKSPGDPNLYARRGSAYLSLREIDAALRDYERAIELGGDDPHLANNYAWTLCLKGRYQEALPWADKAASKEGHWEHLDTRAVALMGVGRKKEAWADLNRALELAPENRTLLEHKRLFSSVP
jgi:Flp pilus assembly protein TadD